MLRPAETPCPGLLSPRPAPQAVTTVLVCLLAWLFAPRSMRNGVPILQATLQVGRGGAGALRAPQCFSQLYVGLYTCAMRAHAPVKFTLQVN